MECGRGIKFSMILGYVWLDGREGKGNEDKRKIEGKRKKIFVWMPRRRERKERECILHFYHFKL